MDYAIPEPEADFDGWAEAPLPVFDAAPSQEELFARLRDDWGPPDMYELYLRGIARAGGD